MKKSANVYQEYNFVSNNRNFASINDSGSQQTNFEKDSCQFDITGCNSKRGRPQTPSVQAQTRISTTQNTPTNTATKQSLSQSQTKASKQESNISSSQTNKFLQITELQMQIQKLNAEQNAKNREIRHLHKINQKRKADLIELEKNVSYYEGRLSMMEDQLVNYEKVFCKIGKQCDQRARYESQVQELVKLFEGFRKQNETLNGKYEEKCYQLNKLTEKYIKLKNKIKGQSLRSKQQKNDGQLANDIKMKRANSMRSLQKRTHEQNQIEKQKQNALNVLNLKISQIQANISNISKQNERLFNDLEDREQIILKLRKELEYFKHGRSEKSIEKISQIRKSSKKRLKSLVLPEAVSTNTQQEYQLFTKQNSLIQQKQVESNKQQSSVQHIFRKLKFNLITQEIPYDQIFGTLTSAEINTQLLTKSPYSLNFMEADVLIQWISEVSNCGQRKVKQSSTSTQQQQKEKLICALAKCFPRYKTILIREQYLMKINIFNAFQNRSLQLISNNNQPTLLYYQQVEKMLKEQWGLKQQEIDITLKGYFEYTGDIEWINMKILGQMIERWHSI